MSKKPLTPHEEEIARLRDEVSRWRRLYLDKPEDRLYHASDRTWWRRDDAHPYGAGTLVRAEPPPETVALLAIAEAAEKLDTSNVLTVFALDEAVKAWREHFRRDS